MWFSQDQTRLPPMPTLGYKIDITVVGSEVGSWFGLKKKGQEARIFQIFGDHGSPLNAVSKNDRLEAFV